MQSVDPGSAGDGRQKVSLSYCRGLQLDALYLGKNGSHYASATLMAPSPRYRSGSPQCRRQRQAQGGRRSRRAAGALRNTDTSLHRTATAANRRRAGAPESRLPRTDHQLIAAKYRRRPARTMCCVSERHPKPRRRSRHSVSSPTRAFPRDKTCVISPHLDQAIRQTLLNDNCCAERAARSIGDSTRARVRHALRRVDPLAFIYVLT